MQVSDFNKYINNPGLLDKESVPQLQKLVKDFPYFQSAHMLLSIASKKWDASVYQQSLKRTAILVTDRSHLFKLIHKYETSEEITVSKALITGTKANTIEAIPEMPISKTEEVKQELDILKAVESATQISPTDIEKSKEIQPAEEEILEIEIQKQVITSFVEKEILKTNTAHLSPDSAPLPGNFTGWLLKLKKESFEPTEKITEVVKIAVPVQKLENKPANPELEKRKQKNKALIDKIIESNPGHIRAKDEPKFFTSETKAKESLLDNEHLVTETLAKIYALQGNVNKAVRAYQILSLKYPQKSAYFATLIQKLKDNE